MRYLKETVTTTPDVIDPSQIHRPEAKFAAKSLQTFRDYSIDDEDPIKARVQRTYQLMHTNQTVDFVQSKHKKWLQFNHYRATIREALEKLNELVDESDPDLDLPNIVHAFQTAEKIREDYPDAEQWDWFHLTGLIHDLGKVMAFFGEPQWAVVGDTFVVGCEWAPSIVYRQSSFQLNVDGFNPAYNTKHGMYEANCGLRNVLMSWGHDEYLYRVLQHNGASLPPEALAMIRFHSFYPWHAAGDYEHLADAHDEEMKAWVLKFNRYDLYTKSTKIPNIEELWPYYQGLIDKYIPGELQW